MLTTEFPVADRSYNKTLDQFMQIHKDEMQNIVNKIESAQKNGEFVTKIHQSEITVSIFQLQPILEDFHYHVNYEDSDDPALIVNWYKTQPSDSDETFDY